ncbi:AmmeMemoRadiSam system protein B [bacterium]|nr:MAG: AmmeMemoRadiSam system protein B [bacterium]
MFRKPCVAGQFYPSDPAELEKTVKNFLIDNTLKERAVAVISPHAGYMYSGGVAGELFSNVIVPDDIILIGPNHTGLGEAVSIMPSGKWELPLGAVTINEKLAKWLLDESTMFSPDISAHLREHSLEVQLPFLYVLNRNINIVPITVMPLGYDECLEVGSAIARAITKSGKDTLIVASSDMNHYEADKKTREKDSLAIKEALALNAKGLLDVTTSKKISMCGVVPATTAIVAAKALGASKARLVKYATSGETSGDYKQVVGYAGIIIQ